MTPAIIRRFAMYHGIDLTGLIDVPGRWEIRRTVIIDRFRHHVMPATCADAAVEDYWRERVVEALTRIEDAELLQERVAEMARYQDAGPTAEFVRIASKIEQFYRFDVARLFAMAAIDPDRWAKVTE